MPCVPRAWTLPGRAQTGRVWGLGGGSWLAASIRNTSWVWLWTMTGGSQRGGELCPRGWAPWVSQWPESPCSPVTVDIAPVAVYPAPGSASSAPLHPVLSALPLCSHRLPVPPPCHSATSPASPEPGAPPGLPPLFGLPASGISSSEPTPAALGRQVLLCPPAVGGVGVRWGSGSPGRMGLAHSRHSASVCC